MTFETIQNFLSILVSFLLVIALPIVIAAAVQHYRVMSARLTENLSEDQRELLVRAVQLAVQVAEQSGILEGLIGEEKRDRAIKYAQDYLRQRGINIDVAMLVDLVESEVKRQFNPETATPLPAPEDKASNALARQRLIDQAVQSAILAAEQSGLSGQIVNTVAAKSAYAVDMVSRYLAPYGIQVDPALAEGLVRAELMRILSTDTQTPPVTS